MTTRQTALTREQKRDRDRDTYAAKLAAEGLNFAQIAAKFDPPLSPDAARAAVVRGRRLATPVARPAASATAKLAPEPDAPAAAAAASEPEPQEAPSGLDDLLEWAEVAGSSRAQTLAARIRTHIDELRRTYVQACEAEQARAEYKAAEAAMLAAKAKLRDLGVRTPGIPDPAAASTSTVRAWARKFGYEVPERGRIPQHIQTAYEHAHQDAAGGAR